MLRQQQNRYYLNNFVFTLGVRLIFKLYSTGFGLKHILQFFIQNHFDSLVDNFLFCSNYLNV